MERAHLKVDFANRAELGGNRCIRRRFPDAWVAALANWNVQGWLVSREAVRSGALRSDSEAFGSSESGQLSTEVTLRLLANGGVDRRSCPIVTSGLAAPAGAHPPDLPGRRCPQPSMEEHQVPASGPALPVAAHR